MANLFGSFGRIVSLIITSLDKIHKLPTIVIKMFIVSGNERGFA